jgi:hypothetical protein
MSEQESNDLVLIHRVPTAFISHSWDSEAHREWVGSLGTRLRSDGVDLVLDEWHLRLGDQLPHFMEKAIRESDFVLIICTPSYKKKSDDRRGGVGFEGNIIGGEVLTGARDRKFVPILREGEWREAAPSWLLGKLYIDLRGNPYPEKNYEQLLSSIYGVLPEAPSIGLLPRSETSQQLAPHAIMRRRAYADLVNASLRVHQAAQNRLLLKKRGDQASRLLLPDVERELEEQGVRVTELINEIHLFSAEPVRKAAGEIVGWVLLARLASTVPPGLQAEKFKFLEDQLEEARKKFFAEALPKFRAEIRNEAGVGEKTANPVPAADV